MQRFPLITIVLSFAICLSASPAFAETEGEELGTELPTLKIEEGRIQNLVGIGESSSTGKIGRKEFEARPLLRNGELLETVPGVIVTQHSGTGKANQYFLRGFNLDHGTDFNTEVDGMPVNMPTHAHGQGYTDLNFIIPELVDHIEYKKGVYYAEKGDFSSAGAAEFNLLRELPRGMALVTVGTDDYLRGVTADSAKVGAGTLLVGAQASSYNGPWDLDESFKSGSGMIRYTIEDGEDTYSLLALGYRSTWNSSDQIPERAVDEGLIDRFGNIDPTDGGNTGRYSLSANWDRKTNDSEHQATAYVIYYRLNLDSNFTFFLDDRENGDQFEQVDRRTIVGGSTDHEFFGKLFDRDTATKVGLQVRADFIPQVALYKTKDRKKLSVTRNDSVKETSLGLFAKNETQWLEKFRTTLGARGDVFYFDVDSDTDENSGNETEGKVSPKVGVVVGPWSETELYLNAGLGFHSNDARGTTIRVDPLSGEAAEQVDPLVVSRGAEVGVRTGILEGLQSTVTYWVLGLDSELLFVGDAGSTEATGKSLRHGVELANYYRPVEWLSVDIDYSFANAEFRDAPAGEDEIPGSIEHVVAAGVALGKESEGPFGSLRLRYFGSRPLVEDDSVRSDSTTLLNARVGYAFGDLQIAIDCLNLLDSNDHDIDYFYESRLPGEPDEGVEDVHFHPVEPLQVRGSLTYRF